MRPITDPVGHEQGVSSLIEYIFITGILMLFMIIMILFINPLFIQGPMDQLTRHAYTDIGNGISTRIVDLYIIAPFEGNIRSQFDIPEDVAGRGYFVTIEPALGGKDLLKVSGDTVEIEMTLAGIGATLGVEGSTSSSGLNEIRYDSAGFP
jgi:hypothetical protein